MILSDSIDCHANDASIDLKDQPKGVQLQSLGAAAFTLISKFVCNQLLHPTTLNAPLLIANSLDSDANDASIGLKRIA